MQRILHDGHFTDALKLTKSPRRGNQSSTDNSENVQDQDIPEVLSVKQGNKKRKFIWDSQHSEYPLPESLYTVSHVMNVVNELVIHLAKTKVRLDVDMSQYCPYHQAPGHDIDECFTFRDLGYDRHEERILHWASIVEQKKLLFPIQEQKTLRTLNDLLRNCNNNISTITSDGEPLPRYWKKIRTKN